MRLAMLGCRGWIRTGDHPINSRMMEPVNGRLPTACRCALMGYMAPDFTTIRRFVAWFSIAVLGVASWLPAEEMIRTSADGRLEHAAAYLISGLAVFTAYPRRLKWLIAILMTYYAGILEFGQLLSPVATRRFWIGQLVPVACCARCCCMTPINEFMRRKARKNMLKLRSIGIRDYSVLEGQQRIGRIRFAGERMPGVWLWNVIVHLTGGLPMGSAKDLDTAKAEFGGLESPEGQDHAGATGGSLPGNEHSGRRLKAGRRHPWGFGGPAAVPQLISELPGARLGWSPRAFLDQ